jgi:hypothetical protein
MIATCSGSVVAVYRAEERADGPAVAWTAELPPASAVGNRVLTAVADDGRVLLTQPGVATVLGPTRESPANPEVQQWVLYHTPGTRAAGPGVSPDVSGPRAFVSGGRAVVGIDADGAVRRWDFDAERPAAKPSPVWRSPDGRWAVEYAPYEAGAPRGSRFLVRDATTGETLHRLTAPPSDGMKYDTAHPQSRPGFLVGSRRFLAEFAYIPSDRPFSRDPSDEKSTWVLYDTDGWRPVATDDLNAGWVGFRFRDGGRGFVSGHVGAGGLTVHDGLTGRVTCDLKLPAGVVVGQFEFDPAGDRLLVASGPVELFGGFGPGGQRAGKKARDARPLDLRMLDTATGETVWERTGVAILSGPETGPGRMAPAQGSVPLLLFAPGGRVLVQYRGSDRARRLWVGRAADGATERTLEIGPDPQSVDEPGGGWRMAPPDPLSIDRDGRRAAVIGDGEVRIFDLDTGDLVATLRGHEVPVKAARLTPDGTRAFTVDSMQGTETRRAPRVHVWDVATGRRVFTLQPPERFPRGATEPGRTNSRFMLSESDRIEFRDGILSVTQFPPYVPSKSEHKLVSGYHEPYTFDGNPVGP